MSDAPAYHHIARALRSEIDAGRWQVGERMPSELELCRQFKVSRNTVRQALDLLHSMNLVTRQQGRGTFIAPQGLSHLIGELKSLTDVLRERGFVPGNEGIKLSVDSRPPIDAIEHLGNSRIWRVDRIRTTDGRPFCSMSSWLPDHTGRQLTVEGLIADGSLYRILTNELGVLLSEATEVIRAEGATVEEAAALSIRRGTPVIVMYRWVSDNRGRPVEYARAAAPGDRYQYLARLRA